MMQVSLLVKVSVTLCTIKACVSIRDVRTRPEQIFKSAMVPLLSAISPFRGILHQYKDHKINNNKIDTTTN
nr:unnamed protein product [Haemonchus contortus]